MKKTTSSVWITLAVAAGRPVFGQIDLRGRMVPSLVGHTVAELWATQVGVPVAIELRQLIVMPGAIYLGLGVSSRRRGVVAAMAESVLSFMRRMQLRAHWLGVDFEWQPNDYLKALSGANAESPKI